jgi:hypothetical protein
VDAKHLFELVLSVVNPERSVSEATRKHGLAAAEIDASRGGERAASSAKVRGGARG